MNTKPKNASDWRVTATVGLCILWGGLLALGWTDALAWTAVAAVAFASALHLILRYDRSLSARQAQAHPVLWSLDVNGIEVGSISDQEYAAIQQRALRDPRIVVGQILNLLRGLAAIGAASIVLTPVALFWLLAWVSVTDPGTLAEAVHALQSPATIAAMARNAISVAHKASCVLVVFSSCFCGTTFGLRSVYHATVGQAVRRHLNCPTKGNLIVWRRTLSSSPGNELPAEPRP